MMPNITHSLINPFLNQWHCVGIQEKMRVDKPFPFQVGDLSLVLWKNADTYSTALNICKHMGSKLDHGKITDTGCLKCPYHGLEYTQEDVIGKTMLHEGKLFWSYQPLKEKPDSVPFFNNPNYVTSYLEVDMPCSLPDSAYNTMDLLHPEFVHNNIFGFGNSIPPTNVKNYNYPNKKDKYAPIGLSFDYYSKSFVTRGFTHTKNFHWFVYPSFSWSRVSFENNHLEDLQRRSQTPSMTSSSSEFLVTASTSKGSPRAGRGFASPQLLQSKSDESYKRNDLIIGVNLLPTGTKKTKWFITIRHNFLKNPLQKQWMKIMAASILTQDYCQMLNQATESDLKQAVLFGKTFENEEPVLQIHKLFTDNYKYPDAKDCVDLYNHHFSHHP